MTACLVTNRLTRRGSTPPLQLYDVAFRIARINDTKQTDTFYFGLGNFSHCSAASGDHCLQCLIDVVHCECDVCEPALVRLRQFAFDQLIVAEDLQSWSILPIPGQAQMNAAKMRIWNRVHFIEPFSTQIALGTFAFASEHVAIESDESLPVSGNQICMRVFCADWHCLILHR